MKPAEMGRKGKGGMEEEEENDDDDQGYVVQSEGERGGETRGEDTAELRRRSKAEKMSLIASLAKNVGAVPVYSTLFGPESDAFMQCPECGMVYSVESEELEGGDGRHLRCSACLHEWFGRMDELLWGTSAAAAAMKEGEAKVAAVIEQRLQYHSRQPVVLEPTEPITLFIGNLSFSAVEEDLVNAFSAYGSVKRCDVPKDRGGRSKGYGFVVMEVREDGIHAMHALQGVSIAGREIQIREAVPKEEKGKAVDETNNQTPVGAAVDEEDTEDEEAFFDGDEEDDLEDEKNTAELGMVQNSG